MRRALWRLCSAAAGGSGVTEGAKVHTPSAERSVRPVSFEDSPARNVNVVAFTDADYAALGSEYTSIPKDKFLAIVPDGYLTPRAVFEVEPQLELLNEEVAHLTEMYKGVDVRDPSTLKQYDGYKPKSLGDFEKVLAVSDFVCGHIAHHVMLEEWQQVFDLQHVEMDINFWLWILHLHMISRRATMVNMDLWAHRREVMQENLQNMFESWEHTCESIMGRPPLQRIRHYIRDLYWVQAINLEEALQHDAPGGDLAVVGALMKFCPLPRPEDLPVYTYYTLTHYLRFHTALLDRLSDEQFSIGNFSFLKPNDRRIFAAYTDIDYDEVIREFTATDEDSAGGASAAADEATPETDSKQ